MTSPSASSSAVARCKSVSVTASRQSPIPAGTSVTFTAVATGCGAAESRFWLVDPSTGVGLLAQAWSAAASWTWNTSGYEAGRYRVVADLRAYGVASPDADASGRIEVDVIHVLPGSPSPTPLGHTATAVLVKDFLVDGGATYTLTLVGPDGAVKARVTPAKRSRMVQMSNVSTSDSRVYYLDGDSQLKYLKPDGTTGAVMSFPVDSTSAAVFAVSPDDKKIAFAIITYPYPVRTRIYVADLPGGANPTEIFSSTSTLEWPAIWEQGRLVLAVGLNVQPQNAYDGFYYGSKGYQVVDPASGTVINSVCATSDPIGPPVPYGTVCTTGGKGYVVADWSGGIRMISAGPSCTQGSLSPQGTFVADACGSGGNLRLLDRFGTVFDSPYTATPLGWIDEATVVQRAAGGQLSFVVVGPPVGGTPTMEVIGIAADGFFVGRIP